MFNVVLIFFGVYTLAMGTIVFLGYFLQRKKENVSEENFVSVDELVLLIPFRNEEHRIQGTLESIKASNRLPKEIIFIDDHSDDGTVALIERELEGIKYTLISSPKGQSGKKRALRYGTSNSDSKYILTMDADVEFAPDYFDYLAKLPEAEMYVLPAIMQPKSPMEFLYEIDLVLVNDVNTGLAGLSRPIVASGANLLYIRDSFNEVDDIESHVASASGDDTYLLRDFREGKKDVRLVSNIKTAVYTETPQSFKEFIDQRLRWIGKTGDIKDNLSTFLAIIQLILTIAFFGFLIYFGIIGKWSAFFALICVKSAVDLILFMPYFFRIKRFFTWTLIPIYELLYPIYVLIILALVFTYKPTWKGRGIYSKK